jgi:hypothetical protein
MEVNIKIVPKYGSTRPVKHANKTTKKYAKLACKKMLFPSISSL